MVKDESIALSLRRQMTATVDAKNYACGETEPYRRISGSKAVKLLAAETHWVRSANLEFYYRYAVIEDAETGERLVVHRIKPKQWKKILGWLAAPDEEEPE